jgi:hypothetical protein
MDYLDYHGKPFNVHLPEGCDLQGTLPTMEKPVSNRSDLMLVFCKDQKQGVCDINGKIVLPPIYDSIITYNEGYFTALADHSTVFVSRDGQPLGKVSTSEFNFSFNAFHQGVIAGEATKHLYVNKPRGFQAPSNSFSQTVKHCPYQNCAQYQIFLKVMPELFCAMEIAVH